MNTELQKKWFVYLSDHHEGPFTPAELGKKQKDGIITNQSYAWAEGMPDWKPIQEIGELSFELKKIEAASKISPAKESKSPIAPKKKSDAPWNLRTKLLIAANLSFLIPFLTMVIISRSGNESLHAKLRPTLNKIVNKAPFLDGVFNLAPNLSDIPSEAKKEIEFAMLGDPSKEIRIAASLLEMDPNRPSIYLATNLPDQTRFDIYLIGNSETLLNRLQHQSQLSVVTVHGIGKSEVLLSENGQSLAKGEYQVWITESPEQEEAIKPMLESFPSSRPSGVLPNPIPNTSKFVIQKKFFVGGQKDEAYLTKLKAFHEKVRSNSEKELIELKQYSDTLTLQFQTLTGDFGKILKSKKVNESHKNNWKTTTKQWTDINNQLEQTIQTWSKETLQNEFFYGSAYELIKSSYDSLKKLFELENEYIEKQMEKSSFEIQYGKAVNECKLSLNQLKVKIDAIMNAPKSANGLPKRDAI